MPSVAVIDYGVGNLFSMVNALRKTGLEVEVVKDYTSIKAADALVQPGVGNFGAAAEHLAPFADSIKEAVQSGVPLLGSCLGMHLLLEWSKESPGDGLSLIKGGVEDFDVGLKVPHMGWNTVNAARESPLLEGVDGEYFYFVHSYYPVPVDPVDSLATTVYGVEFTSVVERGNVYGCQFHPEKSGQAGARLLSNFAGMVRR